jgi:hypothetical protein
MIIRFGYCPPNPGPKARLKNKWFTNKEDAINEYNGGSIWVSYGGKYREITLEQLYNL